MKKLRLVLFGCASIATLTMTAGARAQIEQIVVTAQKKEQSINEVPISILAFGADDIEARRIENLDDLTREIPSFTTIRFFRSQTSPALRGAGTIDDSPGVDQTVAIFVDGVYFAQPGHIAFDLFDLERIEVLRGPQGTLEGRNVTGGAIHVITRTPTDEAFVKGAVTVGNYGRINVDGLLSGPLIDGKLAGQVAFASRNSDGYLTNAVTGNDIEADNIQSIRGKLAWTPSDAVTGVFSLAYSKDKSIGSEQNIVGSSGVVGDPVVGTLTDVDDVVYLNVDGDVDRELVAATARFDIETAIGAVTSITAYYDSDNSGTSDADGTSEDLLALNQSDELRQFSQEVRLNGAADRLEYTVGAFFLSSHQDRRETITIDFASGTFFDEFLGGADRSFDTGRVENDTTSFAVFTDLSYSLTERLKVIAGGRWTLDDKEFISSCLDPVGPFASCAEEVIFPDSDSWDAFTWRGVLQYFFDDQNMAYFSASRGFKSGGFSPSFDALPPLDPDDARLDPEFATSYEVGAKLLFADNRVSINPTVFFTQYSDIQVSQFETDPSPRIIASNAAEAETFGVELELAVNPVDPLDFFASYSFLDGEYTAFIGEEGEDFSGNETIFTPKHSFNVGAAYNAELPRGAVLQLRGDIQYKSDYFPFADNRAESLVDLAPFYNASIRYQLPGERWSFTLWGKNLSDQRRSTGGIDRGSVLFSLDDLAAGAQAVVFRATPPRTFGGAISFEM